MIRQAGWCLAAAMGLLWLPAAASAQGGSWQDDHDAGWAAYTAGDFAEAEARLKAAEQKACSGPRTAGRHDAWDHDLAWVLCTEERPDEGEALAKTALSIREKALGAEHPDVLESLNTVACLYDMDGKLKEAKPAYERCLALAEKLNGKEHASVAAVLDNLATVDHIGWARTPRPRLPTSGALAIREKNPGQGPPTWPPDFSTISGISTWSGGNHAEAEPLLKRGGCEIRQKALGAGHPDVATSLEALGGTLLPSRASLAEEAHGGRRSKALAIYEIDLGPGHPHVARCCSKLADCCRAMGRTAEAQELDNRAKASQTPQ